MVATEPCVQHAPTASALLNTTPVTWSGDQRLRELRHEVLNPLTAALGYVMLLQRYLDDSADPRVQKALGYVDTNVRRACGLLAGEQPSSPTEQGDLRSVLREAVAQVPAPRQADVVLRSATAALLADIWDRTDLVHVFANLLDNAAKYSKQGTLIEVVVGQVAGHAWVSVHDHGIGIARDDLDIVFSGHRTVAAQQMASGSGIGLPLSRRMVERAGGEPSGDQRAQRRQHLRGGAAAGGVSQGC